VDEQALVQHIDRILSDPARLSAIASAVKGTGVQTFPLNAGAD
jgi:hypothetical protein